MATHPPIANRSSMSPDGMDDGIAAQIDRHREALWASRNGIQGLFIDSAITHLGATGPGGHYRVAGEYRSVGLVAGAAIFA